MSYFLGQEDISEAEFSWMHESEASYQWDPWKYRNKPASLNAVYVCQHPGCKSKANFQRKYELQRHMRKHEEAQAYDCPVIGCIYKGANAPYRPDKLKSHLRAHPDDSLSLCPIPGCSAQPLSLYLMSVHLQCHTHVDLKMASNALIVKDYREERSVSVAKCPIGLTKACAKWMKMDRIPAHILSHTVQERVQRRGEAFEAGYDSMTGQLACPMCHATMTDPDGFAQHVHMSHLNDQSGRDHINVCLIKINETRKDNPLLNEWIGKWNVSETELQSVSRWNDCCPACFGIHLFQNGCYSNHHLEIQKADISEVLQKRQQVLKHYPSFVNHPIFNDIRNTSRANGDSQTMS
ncbi:hypothetical protein GTA08_BOTSDO04188 [Neofusicoccum parvum]|uniref:Uncharacterized protein n=1 Tax=Neofusicoccum parvum TaxID=310453 RepID=A0ACB5S7V3_9PEZI|nr:hypothetical protein GTA08_BOTSDO04188 [Neofusicoccum parvum]